MPVREENLQKTADNLRLTFKARRSYKPYASFLRNMALVEQRIRAGDTPEAAVNHVVDTGLRELVSTASVYADILRNRWEGASMTDVSDRTDRSEQGLYRNEKDALMALAKQLAYTEERLRRQRLLQWLRVLPPLPYNRFIGAESRLSPLLPHFQHSDAPWLLALVGMGGIGKTSLAHALVRELVAGARFDRVAWISAQQAILSLDGTMAILADKPALTLATLITELGRQLLGHAPDQWRKPLYDKESEVLEHLVTFPNLVVIDNLETVHDMTHLLPFLHSARGPTKFILTSRATLSADGGTHNYQVPALTFEESLALIQHDAQTRNLPTLLNCDTATAALLHDITGGNPLALRLVVGQVELHGLSSVLDDLRRSSGAGTDLYRYLYGWVWDTLSPVNRAVLFALLVLTDDNSTARAIGEMTNLEPEAIRRALQELTTRNLVMLRGTLKERCYTLHSLTRAFLEEINRTHASTTDPSPGTS